jgi:hypothetical protein
VLEKRDFNTCENCKSFPGYGYYCPIIGRFCDFNNESPCEYFEKPKGRIATNGDVIRQIGNGAFAYMMTRLILDGCPISKSKTWEEMHACKISNDCTNCLKQWLNAPADCVAKNGESAKESEVQ